VVLNVISKQSPKNLAFSPTQTYLGGHGLKWLGSEPDHSPARSTEVRNTWSFSSTHPIRVHGTALN